MRRQHKAESVALAHEHGTSSVGAPMAKRRLIQQIAGPRLARIALVGACITVAAMHVASATERTVHRYLEVRISPDAAYVAAIEGDSPKGGYLPVLRDLVIRRVSDRASTQIALPCGRVPQCWPTSLAWAPDSKQLSFTLRTPGTHTYTLYSVAADGANLTRRLEFSGTLTDIKYSPAGTIAMLAIENARKEVGATEAGAATAGNLDAPPSEQRIATLADGHLHWVSPENLFVYEYDWQPNGRWFVATAAPGDGDNNWWTAKLYKFAVEDGGAQVLYSPTDIRQQITMPKVSPDGRTVAFIAGLMSDFGSAGGDVYTLAIESGSATNATPGIKASAISLGWGCDGRLRAQLLAGGQDELAELNFGQRSVPPRVLWSGADTLGSADTGGDSWACPSGVFAAVRESFTTAPEIVTGKPGHFRNLTSANAGIAAPLKVVSVTWTVDGFDESGWLLLPEHPLGKIPMVTIVHGGPASVAQPMFTSPGLQSGLIDRGWAVFRPNPRGSFGQGERFTAANVRDFGRGDLRDILAGIDAAERIAPIDEDRLGLTGGSYGGFMTMWAITQTQRFKAAVAVAGVSDWQSYYGENGISGWMIPYFGASVYDDPAIYAQSSAINFIRNAHTPTFVYVGERDIESPPPQTEEMWRALKTLGVPTSIMIYPGEGHGLRDPANAADAVERTLAWFDKYLMGEKNSAQQATKAVGQ
jgi:dipeptidyl aminopeptidase/acylaminoacyl peptidase